MANDVLAGQTRVPDDDRRGRAWDISTITAAQFWSTLHGGSTQSGMSVSAQCRRLQAERVAAHL